MLSASEPTASALPLAPAAKSSSSTSTRTPTPSTSSSSSNSSSTKYVLYIPNAFLRSPQNITYLTQSTQYTSTRLCNLFTMINNRLSWSEIQNVANGLKGNIVAYKRKVSGQLDGRWLIRNEKPPGDAQIEYAKNGNSLQLFLSNDPDLENKWIQEAAESDRIAEELIKDELKQQQTSTSTTKQSSHLQHQSQPSGKSKKNKKKKKKSIVKPASVAESVSHDDDERDDGKRNITNSTSVSESVSDFNKHNDSIQQPFNTGQNDHQDISDDDADERATGTSSGASTIDIDEAQSTSNSTISGSLVPKDTGNERDTTVKTKTFIPIPATKSNNNVVNSDVGCVDVNKVNALSDLLSSRDNNHDDDEEFHVIQMLGGRGKGGRNKRRPMSTTEILEEILKRVDGVSRRVDYLYEKLGVRLEE
ncbi:hypothetical protein HDU76_001811 [Blyttiomyces sp. JEL0837]|nr:hypothetical protein HDU76_001811 [Blyttiomyces sp. JEL0837]